MYNVILRTRTGPATGLKTRATFDSKEAFVRWYGNPVKKLFLVVVEGVTDEEAKERMSRKSNIDLLIEEEEKKYTNALKNL